jgi:two-component system, sensor histidine kinase YesM
MRIHKRIQNQLNQISLKTQLTALITIAVTSIIILIIMFNYNRNTATIMSQQISTSSSLLNLETQNLDTYLTEINRYSLLLRNDPKTLQSLTTKESLTYSETTNIQSQIKSNYYSRSDLLSYRLYLLNQTENYEITSKTHKIKIIYENSLKTMPEYNTFTKGKYYKYIKAAKDKNSFFVFYRTIINIEDQEPLAVVELTFDTSFIDSLAKNHDESGEILCMIDKQGQLLYSNNPAIKKSEYKNLWTELKEKKDNHFFIDLNEVKYLSIFNSSTKNDYYLIALKPLELIDYQVNKTRNISLILGLISISLAAVLAVVFINLVTKPLSKLSHRLRKVGKGNFTTTTDISGSLEIAQLADSFNNMIYQINELITKNYLSELNEKTARLIALEAQINPHFLYNTLQAISAEAVMNNQFQINNMITSLAAMLRYSIKGGDMVKLRDEMKHVQDYLSLQHARFHEALTFDVAIEAGTEDLLIPKISIQVLVENSITHGKSGENLSVHIKIDSKLTDNILVITVTDNGMGIQKEQLEALYDSFIKEDSTKEPQAGIGLSNLYNRLKILYGDRAELRIDSIPNEKTTVSFLIDLMEEGENRV